MKYIDTSTVTAFARCKDITLFDAFRECWMGTCKKVPTLDEEKRIMDDVAVYRGQRIRPPYVYEYLAAVRRRQIHENSTYDGESLFI